MIVAWFVRLLLGAGVSQARANRWAPYAAMVALVLLLAAFAATWLHIHDARVIDAHEAKLEARAAPARDQAAQERAQDAIANAQQRETYHDVIASSGPDVPPAPSSLALACERLRRAGNGLPAACRPGGGDRTQASPAP
jgi:hypothetical protein